MLLIIMILVTGCKSQRQFTKQELENIRRTDSIINVFIQDRIQELKEEQHD